MNLINDGHHFYIEHFYLLKRHIWLLGFLSSNIGLTIWAIIVLSRGFETQFYTEN